MECIGGRAEIIVFYKNFLRYKEIIQEGNIVFVSGNPENRSETGNVKMLAEHIVSLDRAEDQLSKHLNILINPDSVSTKEIDELYKIAEQYQGDTRLVFHIPKNGRHQKILAHNIRVSTDSTFFKKLKNIYGRQNIWIE
jgi:DNA polymerase-3 subunit alpha